MGIDGPRIPADLAAQPWTVVTPSRVAEFRRCPRSYFNSTILAIRGEEASTAAVSTGLTVHSILADSHASGGCVSEAAIDDAEATHSPELGKMLRSHRELCPSVSAAGARLLGVELDLAWWDSSIRAHFRGRLDAIWEADGTLTVRDYKTGKHFEDDHRKRFDSAVYAVLAAANYAQPRPIKVEFEYLASGILESVAYDEFGFASALRNVRQVAGELSEVKEFPANPGGQCENCSFQAKCPNSAV